MVSYRTLPYHLLHITLAFIVDRMPKLLVSTLQSPFDIAPRVVLFSNDRLHPHDRLRYSTARLTHMEVNELPEPDMIGPGLNHEYRHAPLLDRFNWPVTYPNGYTISFFAANGDTNQSCTLLHDIIARQVVPIIFAILPLFSIGTTFTTHYIYSIV